MHNKSCSHQFQSVCTQQHFTTKMGVGVISKSNIITLCMAIEDSERFQLWTQTILRSQSCLSWCNVITSLIKH